MSVSVPNARNLGDTPGGRDDILCIENLEVALVVDSDSRPLLGGVSIRVARGETVGLVGESGSGKSLTSRAALGLLPRRATATGSVIVGGTQVLGASARDLREVRLRKAAMIFQDPRSSVNPVRRVGDFLVENMRAAGQPTSIAGARAMQLLEEVGIRDPAAAMRMFPHEFSGGMLQRIVIAGALGSEPALLLADEATTALDVTTQAEVVGLLRRLQAERGMAMLFVTHDLDLAAAACDRICVMYAGRIVEEGATADLFAAPQHPYTVGLLRSSPRLDGECATLRPIQGRPRALVEAPSGCSFRDRCPLAVDECAVAVPPLEPHGKTNAACIRSGEAVFA